MKFPIAIPVVSILAPLLCGAGSPLRAQSPAEVPPGASGAGQDLALTPAQRRAIYAAVVKDKSKTAPRPFAATVGAEVPPMIELYTLPDPVLAENQSAKYYEYTLLQDKVVLVDPTRMRVIDVIGPPPR
jgi:hypothetical protein